MLPAFEIAVILVAAAEQESHAVVKGPAGLQPTRVRSVGKRVSIVRATPATHARAVALRRARDRLHDTADRIAPMDDRSWTLRDLDA